MNNEYLFRSSFRLVNAWTIVAALVSALSAGATAADNTASRAEIVKLMQRVKLELLPGTKNLWCQAFLEDFRQQRNVEHITPVIQTDDFNDPRLRPYKDKCPKLEFNKHLAFLPNTPDEVFDLPPEEQEKHALDVSLGTTNFKLWELEMDDNLANGKEIIFYDQAPNSISSYGVKISGIANPRLGRYRVISLDDCTVLGGVGVGEFPKPPSGPLEYHDVVRYQGENGIYRLTAFLPELSDESIRKPSISLVLNYWDKNRNERYRFGQFCTLVTSGK